jgi:hypothetical protein
MRSPFTQSVHLTGPSLGQFPAMLSKYFNLKPGWAAIA